LPDVERILALTPASRQTMLFSATMPGEIISLSRRYLNQPTRIRAEEPDEGRTVPETAQHVFRAHSMDKPEMLARVLQAEGRGLTIVFCQTKRQCDRLSADLAERGFAVAAVHGDLGQGQREQALRAFRAGKIDVLVATDVAARGIDVEGVTHVVNYSCPDDEKTYLHRIGRTGRAGASGVAVTLVDWDDLVRWRSINQILDLPFPDPPETYSTSDSLYEELSIPRAVNGVLPVESRTRAGLRAERLEDLGGERARRPRKEGARREGARKEGARKGTARKESPRSEGTRKEAASGERTSQPRQRNRTRGGSTKTTAEGVTAAVAGGDQQSDAPKRRRRSRGGRGRGGNTGGTTGGTSGGTSGDGNTGGGAQAAVSSDTPSSD
jgi:superfamily II DNA/RNA helicase